MASTINSTAHGLKPGDRIVFSNIDPSSTGVVDGQIYYVIAAGLTADVFEFSETENGSAVTLAAAIDHVTITRIESYEVADDGIMDPPNLPATPSAPSLTSRVVAGGASLVELHVGVIAGMSFVQYDSALQSGAPPTITTVLGATATAGNLLVAGVVFRNRPTSVVWPAGWIAIPEVSEAVANTRYGEMRYKVSDGTETGFVVTAVAAGDGYGYIGEYAGLGSNARPVAAGYNNTTGAGFTNPDLWPELDKPARGADAIHVLIRGTGGASLATFNPTGPTSRESTSGSAEFFDVYDRLVSDSEPTYAYTNLNTFGDDAYYMAVAFDKGAITGRVSQVQITREFSGADPVWTDAQIVSVQEGQRDIAVRAIGGTKYAVRVRTADVFSNRSLWGTHTEHTTIAGSDSGLAAAVVTSNATPAAVSTAGAAGTDGHSPSRDDHVHAHEAAHINHDTTWAAKGDIITGTANDTAAITTVGANDTILMADSGQTGGVKWVAPATPSTQAFGDAASEGTADTFTRGDHKHAMPAAPSASSVGAIATTFVDAKGDLITASANDTPVILPVGADDTILMADAAASSGLKWVASASPSAVGTAAATGTADTFTRGDHVHAHETAHVAHDTVWDAKGDVVTGSAADTAVRTAVGADGTFLKADSTQAGGVTWAAAAGSVAADAIWDAKGDLAAGTGADTAAKLTVGANDTILMADSGQATGLKWVASASPSAVGTAAATGTDDSFTRGDHVHAHEAAHINHDTTWAAKGDLITGTANDTAAVTTVGADDTILMADAAAGGGVKWVASASGSTQAFGDAAATGTADTFSRGDHKHAMPTEQTVRNANQGTTFPGSPADNDKYWRTDRDMEFYWDSASSHWLSTNLFTMEISDRVGALVNTGISATTAAATRRNYPSMEQGVELFLVRVITTYFVNAGTALGASHKWVGTVDPYIAAGTAGATIVTVTIASGASSAWRRDEQAIAAIATRATNFGIQTSWTKTGTPGPLLYDQILTYRVIET